MTETIFMIHGMFGGPWVWEPYRRFFEEKGYRCVTPTLRLHRTDLNPSELASLGRTSVLDYASDLEAEIWRMERPPVIMGHSMGGLLTQMLGARGLGRALVLLTPASPRGVLALKPSVVKSFGEVMTRWGFWSRPFRLSYDRVVYSMLGRTPEADRRGIYERFTPESGRAAFEIGFWLLDGRRAAAVDPGGIRCPMLVVGAEEDRITPESVVRNTARRYGAWATYRAFPGHAHWVLGEPGWENIAEFVLGWLRRTTEI